MKIYNLLFKRFLTTKGRSSRLEYITKFLFSTGIFLLGAYTFDECNGSNIITLIYVLTISISSFIIIIQYFPLAIRRLHDLNASGWYVLLTFVPFGQFLILWLMFKKGADGSNKYGDPPKY